MTLETYGRWPLVGATALGPVTAAAVRRSEWRPLAALLWHQSEEWVWPGGFLPWINREVLDSADDEFPIDRRLGLAINVGFGWGLSFLSMAGSGATVPTAALYVSHIGNAGLHIGWAIRKRRYDPGLATAALALAPVGVTGLLRMARDPQARRSSLVAGVAVGVAISVGLAPMMKARVRRRAQAFR